MEGWSGPVERRGGVRRPWGARRPWATTGWLPLWGFGRHTSPLWGLIPSFAKWEIDPHLAFLLAEGTDERMLRKPQGMLLGTD